MHSRSIIRIGIFNELLHAGAWGSSVYIEPLKPVDENSKFPNVCIFARDDRTVEKKGNEFLQGLKITLEIRARRENNSALNGGENKLAVDLDSLCSTVEKLVVGIFQKGFFEIDGHRVAIDDTSEINTTITPITGGAAPYMLAELEFEIRYRTGYCRKPPVTCDLQKIIGEIAPVSCGEDGQSIHANTNLNNPTTGAC